MHRRLCEELLAEEVAVVNRGSLRQRLDRPLWAEGTTAFAKASGHGGSWVFCLRGPNYNAEPLSLAVLDPDSRKELGGSEWPPGLLSGQHPSLGKPFTCMQGLYEYHTHISHLDNPWDRHRDSHRLDVVVRNILNRAQL